jgi:hypothetical protein
VNRNDSAGWIELLRACAAIPLGADGSELPEERLSPGQEVRVIEDRGERLVVSSRGGLPAREWLYLVRRLDFDAARTPPEGLPREGQAPTAPATTAGSPD